MKTNRIWNLAVMIVVGIFTSITLTSCPDGPDDPIDNDEDKDNVVNEYKVKQLISTLKGSTWRMTSTVASVPNASLRVYFTDQVYAEGKNDNDEDFKWFYINTDGDEKDGFWGYEYSSFNNNYFFDFYIGKLKSDGSISSSLSLREKYGVVLSDYYFDHISVSTNKVEINEPGYNPYTITFIKEGNGNLINGGSSGSGGSSNSGDFYETNFNSTEYTTKIKVDFYFSEKLSSATIKYGTTSSCSSSKSATVSGVCATATISGLKSGTKYYFKCTAKSKNGESCTTGVYPAMTNY